MVELRTQSLYVLAEAMKDVDGQMVDVSWAPSRFQDGVKSELFGVEKVLSSDVRFSLQAGMEVQQHGL